MVHELSPPVHSTERQDVDDVTVIMPIGGLATRARLVTGDKMPKHLIRLDNGQTVLDTITTNLQKIGFGKFVFCLGHHSEQLVDHLASEEWKMDRGVTYDLSLEERPLGPDGAIMKAIGDLSVKGQAMIIPGDLMLPWDAVRDMNIQHAREGSDMTIALTSHITPRTTDVGKIIGEAETGRLLWCYPRGTETIPNFPGAENLTSAAATAISVERYQSLCNTYLADEGADESRPLSLRDEIMPWAAQKHPEYDLRVFDIKGEILDLGTPSNIHYGQQNWSRYA